MEDKTPCSDRVAYTPPEDPVVLQSTERRSRPPILVEPATAVDQFTVEVLQVLDAARIWDTDLDKFSNILRAPRLRWEGLFGAAASTGVQPRRELSVMVGPNGLLVDLT